MPGSPRSAHESQPSRVFRISFNTPTFCGVVVTTCRGFSQTQTKLQLIPGLLGLRPFRQFIHPSRIKRARKFGSCAENTCATAPFDTAPLRSPCHSGLRSGGEQAKIPSHPRSSPQSPDRPFPPVPPDARPDQRPRALNLAAHPFRPGGGFSRPAPHVTRFSTPPIWRCGSAQNSNIGSASSAFSLKPSRNPSTSVCVAQAAIGARSHRVACRSSLQVPTAPATCLRSFSDVPFHYGPNQRQPQIAYRLRHRSRPQTRLLSAR